MWFLLRPDATKVWNNPEVCKSYTRYKDILDKKKIARYLITKKIPVSITENASIEKLWEEHDTASEKFKDMLSKIDDKKIDLKDIETPKNSFLDLKEKIANEMLKNCHFCERRCNVDRSIGKTGFCKLDKDSYVSSFFLHTGEESVLVPSGTIFFTGCTFTCVFCQNHDISQEWCNESKTKITGGVKVTPEKLALISRNLWKDGAKNINLVGGDPTPNLHTIISSL